MEQHTYRFVLEEPRCVSVDSTTVRDDCDAAKKMLSEIKKFDFEEDKIMVFTGTCDLIFILNKPLTQEEINDLQNTLNKQVFAAMSAEIPSARGDMNIYLLKHQSL